MLPSGAKDRENSRHLRAIEFLAETTRAPLDQVTKIYQRELAKLKVGGRVNDFLPILTIRKVRGHFGSKERFPS
jgi:hypothetical protein